MLSDCDLGTFFCIYTMFNSIKSCFYLHSISFDHVFPVLCENEYENHILFFSVKELLYL